MAIQPLAYAEMLEASIYFIKSAFHLCQIYTAFSRLMKYKQWGAETRPLRGGEAPTPSYLTRVEKAIFDETLY
nr:MAG: hypothetical protein EDM05_00990 [Leptolyngbya sp. IPPAS B-1204]